MQMWGDLLARTSVGGEDLLQRRTSFWGKCAGILVPKVIVLCTGVGVGVGVSFLLNSEETVREKIVHGVCLGMFAFITVSLIERSVRRRGL
jgi:hypothetical protein